MVSPQHKNIAIPLKPLNRYGLQILSSSFLFIFISFPRFSSEALHGISSENNEICVPLGPQRRRKDLSNALRSAWRLFRDARDVLKIGECFSGFIQCKRTGSVSGSLQETQYRRCTSWILYEIIGEKRTGVWTGEMIYRKPHVFEYLVPTRGNFLAQLLLNSREKTVRHSIETHHLLGCEAMTSTIR